MEQHTVKHCTFRMTLVINPAHGRDIDSRNTPGRRIVYFPLLEAKLDFRINQEAVNGCLLSHLETNSFTSFFSGHNFHKPADPHEK